MCGETIDLEDAIAAQRIAAGEEPGFRCSKCATLRPASAFYQSRGKRRASCKFCARAYAATRRKSPPKVAAPIPQKVETCKPIKRGGYAATLVAIKRAGAAMSKLRDFAAGKPVEFSEEEARALIEAGLLFEHDHHVKRLLLTESGWAAIEGPTEEQSRERAR